MFGLERAAPCDVGITEALVGDGVVNPGDSRRLALAPDQPGVGTPETATGPGSTLSLPGVGPTHSGSNGSRIY